jgi:hypothetical protein
MGQGQHRALRGFFGAKGVGSKWAPGNFLELVLSCPVAGTSAQFLISSENLNERVLDFRSR